MWGATLALPKYKESFVVTLVDKYCACDEAISPLLVKAKLSLLQKWTLVKQAIVTNPISF